MRILLRTAAITLAVTAMTLSVSANAAKDPARKAAHDECAGSVAKGKDGKPDHKAMRECMTGKGFTPKHPAKHADKDNAPPLAGEDKASGAPHASSTAAPPAMAPAPTGNPQ